MITLRALLLCIVPGLTILVVAITFITAPYERESYSLLAILLMLMCALTASRLSRHRQTPDLRFPFFLNTAGGVALLVGLMAYLAYGLWYYLMHRGVR
jgi:Ca2+/Na+ antiporter